MSETKYITTPIAVSIHPADENPLFGDNTVMVFIEDAGAGPFVSIEGTKGDAARGEIAIDIDQLRLIVRAVDDALTHWPGGEW